MEIQYKNQLKRILNSFFSLLLFPFEKILEKRSKEISPKAIFIIGAPRSGTTLLYELVCSGLNVGYISNFSQKLYRVPLVASFLTVAAIQKRKAQYKSELGQIDDLLAPSENGRIWRYLLPNHFPYCYPDRPNSKDRFVSLVKGINRIFNGPFVLKYLHFSTQAKLLNEIFPECLFIHVDRDISSNVHSILKARKRKPPLQVTPFEKIPHSAKSSQQGIWWSSAPREWRVYVDSDEVTQVSAQVFFINRNIKEDMEDIGLNRCLNINYSDICENPNKILDMICSFAEKHNITIQRRDYAPESFKESIPKIEPSLKVEISNAVTDMHKKSL